MITAIALFIMIMGLGIIALSAAATYWVYSDGLYLFGKNTILTFIVMLFFILMGLTGVPIILVGWQLL